MGVSCSSNIFILGEALKATVTCLVIVRGMVPGAGRSPALLISWTHWAFRSSDPGDGMIPSYSAV